MIGLLAGLSLSADARKPSPPLGGELRLPLGNPVVIARIGDVSLRLRVDFDQRDAIELNPAAAARLAIPFVTAEDAEVGRVRLPRRLAIAKMTVAGQEAEIQLATHDRDCCEAADGAIGVSLLPFEVVRLTGAQGTADAARSFQMVYSKETGLEIRQPTAAGPVMIQFSLHRPGVIATKSAGAILARAHDGQLDPASADIAGPFGITRPGRNMTLGTPVRLAGFLVKRMQVRTADFGGRRMFPQDAPRRGDIVVRKRVRAQLEWPSVLLGREFLSDCSEILYWTQSRMISLRCPGEPAHASSAS